jgi:RNA polymerase sigma-70 factor (ECF subfamily)
MKESLPDPTPGERWLQWYREGKAGDQEARERLSKELRPFIRALAQKQESNQKRRIWDASDITQESLLKLFTLPREQEFKGTTVAEFVTWVQKLVQNKSFDAIRHDKAKKRGGDRFVGGLPGDAEGEIALAANTSSPSAAMTRQEEEQKKQEERRRYEEALERLSEDHRRVICLRMRENLSVAEVAQKMDRSEEAVKQLYQRALARLHKLCGGKA